MSNRPLLAGIDLPGVLATDRGQNVAKAAVVVLVDADGRLVVDQNPIVVAANDHRSQLVVWDRSGGLVQINVDCILSNTHAMLLCAWIILGQGHLRARGYFSDEQCLT